MRTTFNFSSNFNKPRKHHSAIMEKKKKMMMRARMAIMTGTVKIMISTTPIEIYTAATRGNISWLFKIMLELQSVILVSIQNFLLLLIEVSYKRLGELAESLVPNPLTAHEVKNNEKIQKQILYETAIAEVMR